MMKIRHHYGRLQARTFELSRADVEQIVRDHISSRGLSVPIPLGAQESGRTPFYWTEEWDDESETAFLKVRQEFVYDVTESAPAIPPAEDQP